MPQRNPSVPRPSLTDLCLRASVVGLLLLGLAGATAQISCTGHIENPDAQRSEDPDPETPDGTVDTGLDDWNAHCAGCHGSFEGASAVSTGNGNGDHRLDANAVVLEHGDGLATYIEDTMPPQSADSCQGECAALTAEYIRSRQRAVVDPTCDGEGSALTYGVRELKLLTSREYQRSLEDLLGVESDLGASVANNDGVRGGFVNMRGKGVGGSTLERYIGNAEAVAAWAVARGKPFTCTDPAVCAQRFADEFLFVAFRGPISAAQRAEYTALFESYPSDGMQLALEAALTSPHFLYRVEAGVDLETALARGYYSGGGNTTGPAEETILAADFPSGSGHLEGDVWAFWENGGVDLHFATSFTDPTTVQVEASGTNYGDLWPELTLKVGGAVVAVQTINHTELRTYSFPITGQTGTPTVRVEFNNDAGEAPWGPGQDINLYVGGVGIATATDPVPPDQTESPLDGVAVDAWVLTPYELASALSFMLTGSTPDGTLLEAARAGQLTTRDQIEAQVVRLIDSPRGKEHFGAFVSQWFGLERVKSATRADVPELTPEVRASMVREVQEHFWHVFYDDAAPYSEFFGGDYTFVNQALAEFYGVQGSFTDAFTQTAVTQRGGPIASGAFMAANAHAERTAPVLRAARSRQTALCQYIDPPNSPIAADNIVEQRAAALARIAEREAQEGTLSSRDFYFLYTDGIDACAVCHARVINPMFGMEDFDNVGRLRPSAGADAVIETIRGEEKVVPLGGTLFGVESTNDPTTIEFAGAKDFSNQIAETDAVKSCLVRRGFRFATGSTFHDQDLDIASQETITEQQRQAWGCVASRMKDAFLQSGESPRSMFIELATESLWRLRR
jgi:mono/diheme cytochrome c family protein